MLIFTEIQVSEARLNGLIKSQNYCAKFPTCVENIGHTSKFGEWQGFPNSTMG